MEGGGCVAEIQVQSSKTERKRRWKETSSSREGMDKDVVTVTVKDATVEDEEQEKDQVMDQDLDEKPESEVGEEEKEEVLEPDEKDEELDYEEPIEHASEFLKPAKVRAF